jgi:L-fuculose-phosphate aldolase
MGHTIKIRKELVKYGRRIYEEGLVIGTGGNISVRTGSRIYLKASSASLKDSGPADYVPVDIRTGKQCGGRKRCSIELPMHIACYTARPDIGAVVHTHPVFASAFAMAGNKKMGLVSYELVTGLGSEVPVIGYFRCGTIGLGAAVKRAIKGHNAILLKNHGSITVGRNLEEAFMRSLALERACRTYLISKLLAKPAMIPRSELKRLLKR